MAADRSKWGVNHSRTISMDLPLDAPKSSLLFSEFVLDAHPQTLRATPIRDVHMQHSIIPIIGFWGASAGRGEKPAQMAHI
jgi:hypothetical protein